MTNILYYDIIKAQLRCSFNYRSVSIGGTVLLRSRIKIGLSLSYSQGFVENSPVNSPE